MNARRITILLACFWVTLMASTAMAGAMHLHAHPAMVTDGAPWHPHTPAVSPFEVKLGDNVSIVNCWGTTLCFPVHTIRFL